MKGAGATARITPAMQQSPERTFTETGSHQGQLATKAPLGGELLLESDPSSSSPCPLQQSLTAPAQELLPHFSRTINSLFHFLVTHTHTHTTKAYILFAIFLFFSGTQGNLFYIYTIFLRHQQVTGTPES